jgi:hypothetical protein
MIMASSVRPLFSFNLSSARPTKSLDAASEWRGMDMLDSSNRTNVFSLQDMIKLAIVESTGISGCVEWQMLVKD